MGARFSHSLLNSDEAIQFYTRFSGLLKNKKPEDLYLQNQATAIEAGLSEISTLNQRDSKNSNTDTLVKYDSKRDEMAEYILDGAENFAKRSSIFKNQSISGKKIVSVFKKHGYNKTAPYAEESAHLNGVIEELEADKSALLDLNLEDALLDLKSYNEDFETAFTQKVDEDSNKIKGYVRPIIRKVANRVNYALHYVESNGMDNPDQFLALDTELKELITTSLTPARARKTRKENEVVAE